MASLTNGYKVSHDPGLFLRYDRNVDLIYSHDIVCACSEPRSCDPGDSETTQRPANDLINTALPATPAIQLPRLLLQWSIDFFISLIPANCWLIDLSFREVQ